jgi:hypothetical protein
MLLTVLAVLQEQVQELTEPQRSITKWLEANCERPSCVPSQRHSEKLSARHAFEHELVRDLPSHICLTGVLTCKLIGFGVLSVRTLPNTFVRSIVMRTILRQLRLSARIKTLFLRCSST